MLLVIQRLCRSQLFETGGPVSQVEEDPRQVGRQRHQVVDEGQISESHDLVAAAAATVVVVIVVVVVVVVAEVAETKHRWPKTTNHDIFGIPSEQIFLSSSVWKLTTSDDRVHSRLRPWLQGWVIAFRDRGPGFNSQSRGRLFQRKSSHWFSASVSATTISGFSSQDLFLSYSLHLFISSGSESHISFSFHLLLLLNYNASCTKLTNGLSVSVLCPLDRNQVTSKKLMLCMSGKQPWLLKTPTNQIASFE